MMTINKVLLALTVALAWAACTNQQRAEDSATEATKTATSGQQAADNVTATDDMAAADAAQTAADAAASSADAAGMATRAAAASDTAFGEAGCKGAHIPSDTSWLHYNRLEARFDIGVVQDPDGGRGTWSIVSANGGNEFLITMDSQRTDNQRPEGPRQRGSVLRIGRATLVKDFPISNKEDLANFVGTPILFNTIAMTVLDQAFPRGPASVTSPATFAIDEKQEVLCGYSNTPGVKIGEQEPFQLRPPWTSRGSVRRLDSQTVAFKLRFIDQSERSGWIDIKFDFELEGTWRREVPEPKLPDSMDLTGWRIQIDSSATVADAAADAVVFAALTVDDGVITGARLVKPGTTLGKLRSLLARPPTQTPVQR